MKRTTRHPSPNRCRVGQGYVGWVGLDPYVCATVSVASAAACVRFRTPNFL